MPITYLNLASTTLGGNQAIITFDNISQQYTDLVLRWSARTTNAVNSDAVGIRFNNINTANNYAYTRFNTIGQSSAVGGANNATSILMNGANGTLTTANTFSNSEVYISGYTAAASKAVRIMAVVENNSNSGNLLQAESAMFIPTTAISRIDIFPNTGGSFVANSSFYLYGIKNT